MFQGLFRLAVLIKKKSSDKERVGKNQHYPNTHAPRYAHTCTDSHHQHRPDDSWPKQNETDTHSYHKTPSSGSQSGRDSCLAIFNSYKKIVCLFYIKCYETTLSGQVMFIRRCCKCGRALCLPHNYSVLPSSVVH